MPYNLRAGGQPEQKASSDWSQDEPGLKVAMPAEKPCEHAIVLKIALA